MGGERGSRALRLRPGGHLQSAAPPGTSREESQAAVVIPWPVPASRRPCPQFGRFPSPACGGPCGIAEVPAKSSATLAERVFGQRGPGARYYYVCFSWVCFPVPLQALCGGPCADSVQTRRHVGGTRAGPTWAWRALLGLLSGRASLAPLGAGVRQCRDSCDIRCHVGGTRDRAARSTKEGGPKEPEKKGRREARGKAWGGCFPEVLRDSGRHGRRASLARIVCSALPESGIR